MVVSVARMGREMIKKRKNPHEFIGRKKECFCVSCVGHLASVPG
jgi:hypothetical protein